MIRQITVKLSIPQFHANVRAWQTQVGVCERRKNSRQTRWQTVGDK